MIISLKKVKALCVSVSLCANNSIAPHGSLVLVARS